jgi:hypothetical protein
MSTTIVQDRPLAESTEVLSEHLQSILSEIEDRPYTLADAIREGCSVTEQNVGNWTDGSNACALQAALVSIDARKKAQA